MTDDDDHEEDDDNGQVHESTQVLQGRVFTIGEVRSRKVNMCHRQ